jgi:oligopeptide/dipeptide ABC transporter ATP-binding protein
VTEILLSARGLKKHFPVTKGIVFMKQVGAIRAVDGINFTINRGETFGLVGESGCGKTTTAKLILLLEEITSGTILFNGKDIQDMTRQERKQYRSMVQPVFQDPFSSLSPRLRVGGIISEPMVECGYLSKREIKERCSELQRQLGLTYLLIAHDLAVVKHMSRRIGVMYLGKLVEIADGDHLYSDPLHPYTRALLSAALPSHPDARRDEIILRGEVPSPLAPPPGCRFHTRCDQAKPVCTMEEPTLKDLGINHLVACHDAQ